MASPTDTRISEAYITRLVGSVLLQLPSDHEIFPLPHIRAMIITVSHGGQGHQGQGHQIVLVQTGIKYLCCFCRGRWTMLLVHRD